MDQTAKCCRCTNLNLNSAEEELFQSQLNTMELSEKEQIMQITTSWERKGRVEGQLLTEKRC